MIGLEIYPRFEAFETDVIHFVDWYIRNVSIQRSLKII